MMITIIEIMQIKPNLNCTINMHYAYISFHSYFYSTTKHKILQISNHNLLCSLDPPNQGWLF